MTKLNDILNLFSKLTFRRVWNMAQLYTSFYIAKWTGKPVQWGLPMTVTIEPTTACNLRCPECPSGLRSFTRATGNLKEDFFRKTIDELYKELVYLMFYYQGEPYINHKFLDMVEYANNKGIYTITSTNGHFFTDKNCKRTIESGLSRLIISIDGTTQEVYENYRIAGSLDKVIEGTKNMLEWRKKMKSKTPYILIQFLVVKPNEHQIDDIKKLGEELGVDEVVLKSAQIYDYKNGNELIPTLEEYSRYAKKSDGTYVIKNQMLNQCWKLWHDSVITWNGIVVPCCFDKDAKYKMGNLHQKSFKEIWHNEAYRNFRISILKGRSQIDICRNCSEGCNVWFSVE